jgi:XTP/dITP diphosphohydrolase
LKLLFATQNPHKRDEVQALVGNQFEILSLRDLQFKQELPETHETLEENALEKALFVHQQFSIDCFSEDTGLEIDVLGGAPGVYSARYAGEGKKPQDNVAKVLQELGDNDNRKARFRTVICLFYHNETQYFEGIVNGTIAKKPAGEMGFGYDPIFIPEGTALTFAQMNASEKNGISHRRIAIDKMILWLNQQVG